MTKTCFWHPGEHDEAACPASDLKLWADDDGQLLEEALVALHHPEAYVTDASNLNDFPAEDIAAAEVYFGLPRAEDGERLWKYLDRVRAKRKGEG